MKLELTAKDILNKKFRQSPNGYNPEEVDAFLDKILEDYKSFDAESKEFELKLTNLKRENEVLKANIREKDYEISIQKGKNLAASTAKNSSLDNLTLLQRCGAYEKKLHELGVDPSKIK